MSGRESSRARERKRVQHLLSQDDGRLTERRKLSVDEVREFFWAVYKRRSQDFGVVRIGGLDMDDLYDPDLYLREKSEIYFEPKCTLLALSSLLDRAAVVASLLAGGASPSVRYGTPESCKPWQILTEQEHRDVKHYFDELLRRYRHYAVWVLRAVTSMRLDGVQARSPDPCGVCSSELVYQPLMFQPCGHFFCEPCFWRVLVADRRRILFPCPLCGVRREAPTQTPTKATAAATTATGTGTTATGTAPSPFALRDESCARFLKLPRTHTDATGKRLRRPPKFRAAILETACSFFVGQSQSRRAELFEACVSEGDRYRVEAVLRAGVDVNAQNQYGQTCLCIAAWLGHAHIVTLLLEHGADPTLAANGGQVSPMRVAMTCNRSEVVSILSALEPSTSSLPSVPQPPFFCDNILGTTPHQLIESTSTHKGAGACYIDGAFGEDFLEWLNRLWKELPRVQQSEESALRNFKKSTSCALRIYYCDLFGWITAQLSRALDIDASDVRPHMRFLHYPTKGGALPPHTDLSKPEINGTRQSTHTFILYLGNNDGEGGETALLPCVSKPEIPIATVSPRRGRLLVFPHRCPHEGKRVIHPPKILLRGELFNMNTI